MHPTVALAEDIDLALSSLRLGFGGQATLFIILVSHSFKEMAVPAIALCDGW